MICQHYEYTNEERTLYADLIELCEDCDEPMIFSCCNDEMDPSPEEGGFCPTCREHVL